MTNDEYSAAFGLPTAKKADIEKVLDRALEIRKFEIDLYWKRAAYFWAFLAITLGGYFTVLGAKFQECDEKGEALLTISCLGLIFSVAWYFVNRASKFWQENWENHVDLLESSVDGPLYKTVVFDADLGFWKLNGPYPFSVSKVNQLLSLFVVALFLLLAAGTLHRYFGWPWPLFNSVVAVFLTVVLLTIVAVPDWRAPKHAKANFLPLLANVGLLATWWLWRPQVSSVMAIILTVEAVAVLFRWGRTDLKWRRPQRPTNGTIAKQVYAVRRTTEIV